jgi:hypothetical protein
VPGGSRLIPRPPFHPTPVPDTALDLTEGDDPGEALVAVHFERPVFSDPEPHEGDNLGEIGIAYEFFRAAGSIPDWFQPFAM